MQVRLKVLHGSSAGKEIKVPEGRLLIGRHQDCHLRPKLDAVSRRHCEIVVEGDRVLVRDLKSKNGTFVNDERVEGERELQAGDRLRIARLEFEVIIKGAPEPAVKAAAGAAKETEKTAPEGPPDDELIGDWLFGDEAGASGGRTGDTETRQFRVDDTEATLRENEPAKADEAAPESGGKRRETPKPGKKPPGKLPKRSLVTGADTSEAASEMLKKFFNRR